MLYVYNFDLTRPFQTLCPLHPLAPLSLTLRSTTTIGLYLSSDQDNTDWTRYYQTVLLTDSDNASAPHSRGFYNIADPEQVKRVLGGEGCLWGDHTNGDVMNVRLWPRAAAMAEALWSDSGHNGEGGNVAEAYPGLLRHRCRMRQRGVPVTPLQPGLC